MELEHFKACSWINGIHIKLAMELQVYYFNWITAKKKKKAGAYSGISDSIP